MMINLNSAWSSVLNTMTLFEHVLLLNIQILNPMWLPFSSATKMKMNAFNHGSALVLLGARVIGCCAHITALIWHLDVCQSEIIYPSSALSATKFLQTVSDCIQYSDIEESDDEYNNSETSDSDES